MDLKKAKRAYDGHKKCAKRRGIPFLLTFDKWLDLWISSGHWEERGRGKDKYCMSRIGDLGAYVAGNVFIQTNSQNTRDSNARPEFQAKLKEAMNRPEVRAKMSASAKEALAKPEVRAKMRAAQLGKVASDEAKEKRSGDKNCNSKLSKEQVLEIAASTIPDIELMEIYGVGATTIWRIKRGGHYHQK